PRSPVFPYTTLVRSDVGGAHGILLAAILKANPKLRGILFDLPRVTATARESLETQGIAQRCEVVTGDFLESVPAGADIHVLKQRSEEHTSELQSRVD